jgi:hypothetical protein
MLDSEQLQAPKLVDYRAMADLPAVCRMVRMAP